MGSLLDICKSCVHDEPGFMTVVGKVSHCCGRYWRCKPGLEDKEYVPRRKENE